MNRPKSWWTVLINGRPAPLTPAPDFGSDEAATAAGKLESDLHKEAVVRVVRWTYVGEPAGWAREGAELVAEFRAGERVSDPA